MFKSRLSNLYEKLMLVSISVPLFFYMIYKGQIRGKVSHCKMFTAAVSRRFAVMVIKNYVFSAKAPVWL